MNNTVIHHIHINQLTPWKKNARRHSKKQLQQIAASIREFGFTNPVLIDQNNTILAGHGRVEAAKLLDWEKIPCLYIEHMDDKQKRAYVLADNKIALNATWDEDLLSQELSALAKIDLGFEIALTGFSIAEIDSLIEEGQPEDSGKPQDEAIPTKVRSRCNTGDIWALGEHRLICGNSLDSAVTALLMNGRKAQMIFTDPPYNVPIEGHVSGKGKARHDEFVMASGEMSKPEFTLFLRNTFTTLSSYAVNGSIHFICMDWRHMGEVMNAAEGIYDLKNLIVWAKDNGGMETFYRSRHEIIFAYKHGNASHINNFELGQHGRYRTNVWEYRGANLNELDMHPTVKPVQMIADAIKDVSGRGDAVLDLFGGSGSTLIAAEKTGRCAYLCEIDPKYCDTIIARYENYAKDEAIQLCCGLQ